QQQNQQQNQPPFGGRTVEQQIQRIKTDAQSFYGDLFNRRNSPNTGEFSAFLAAVVLLPSVIQILEKRQALPVDDLRE
ncbi:MAG: hypothetical protein CVV51_12880, partial [Spirochaetae bacterium HGW-Spirochaetae-7]